MYSVLIPSGISNQPAWWRVDLGASYDVYQVVIVNTNLGQGEFFVQVGNGYFEVIRQQGFASN